MCKKLSVIIIICAKSLHILNLNQAPARNLHECRNAVITKRKKNPRIVFRDWVSNERFPPEINTEEIEMALQK